MKVNQVEIRRKIEAAFDRASEQRAFLERARQAVHYVVEEMICKAHPRLREVKRIGEGAGTIASLGEDVDLYFVGGLLVCCGKEDVNCTARKLLGHEIRGLAAIQRSLARAKIVSSRTSTFKTPRACLVDYFGLRFYVTEVNPINGHQTLVHGHIEYHDMKGAKATSKAKDLSANQVNREVESQIEGAYGQSRENAIDNVSLPPFTLALRQLARDLNTTAQETSDLQVHFCYDGRAYLTNFARITPPDLPKPGSHEILTKVLRPEFVRSYTLDRPQNKIIATSGRKKSFLSNSDKKKRQGANNSGRVNGRRKSSRLIRKDLPTVPKKKMLATNAYTNFVSTASKHLDVAKASQFLLLNVIPSFVQNLDRCVMCTTRSSCGTIGGTINKSLVCSSSDNISIVIISASTYLIVVRIPYELFPL